MQLETLKYTIFFYINGFSKSMEPNKCIFIKNIYKNIHLNVSYDFSKFDESRKIKE
jgi:hypothetical protein